MRSYAIGFAISLALTLGSFGTVMSGVVPPHLRLGVLVLLAVVQLVVQLIYFLHMGTAKSQRENTAIFLCTGLLIAIIVAGSLWVMHNANVNMMPGHGMSVPQAMSHE
ncbi:cytochrome o ubiquinol oxidase subunit IV [Luteibacter sp. Sphag1AF]|uniref:cytochrome o ubiquinol oxidase subunit IV n=1 Tax=Luteibacter sp. Sphag1AF TaxID=2587031 RepID=UPI002107AE50|nr:cytochrome o ubiquinol oxidase subunit IV [Luteibacter sp. Sphag1AF]